MYYADFDGNGSVDPIFSTYLQGKRYPYLTRDELIGQLPVMRKRFSNFKTYADVTMDELFDKSSLNTAGHLQVTQTETVLYLSTADGKWVKSSLPAEVQYSPAYAFEPLDFNGDGHLDILFGGNSGSAKIRLGKMDASYGGLLQGDGKGGFAWVSNLKSGLAIRGNIRSILQVNDKVLIGVVGEPVKAVTIRK